MNWKQTKFRCTTFFFCLSALLVNGQEKNTTTSSPFIPANVDKMFSPIIALETWTTYSTGESLNEASDRPDLMLRRFRFGAKGNPYPWLKYTFQLHLDRWGESAYSATKGSAATSVSLWNAYITAKLLPESELLNLHAGYLWSAVSRDFQTSPWAISSFDKTRACFYMRSFITGKGNGIESGIALGGLKNFEHFGINYRVGAYSPEAYQCDSAGCLLYTGRVMFSFGDPEQTKYKYMLSGNAWKKRKGVTLGFGGSTQSNGSINDTLSFKRNMSYGADLLVDYNGFRIEGEYFLMLRQPSGKGYDDYHGTEFHIRTSYNFVLGKYYLEPAFQYEKYKGEGLAALYSGKIGTDETYDIGINWYVNKDKLKLALHYTVQEGEGIKGLNTGDFVGLALQFRL